ncbi:MAG: endonuclease IV [Pelotomaculum sp. PtaB.Bin104]|nr:MAG: endonuclease IV [Pelotomaculum sp. PtaB.Bin104]
MFNIGLKLWSTNFFYAKPALQLYNQGFFDYVELYIVPGTFTTFAGLWKELPFSYMIHAPHTSHNFNLARAENATSNKIMFKEVINYADKLKAPLIIVHPGVNGHIAETISQISDIGDSRIIVENKPAMGLYGERCVGVTAEEIFSIMQHCGTGFCFDIGHAVCAANTMQTDHNTYIREFLSLDPAMYHISDGLRDSQKDAHLHFGTGNYDLAGILALLVAGKRLSIETVKDSNDDLNDFKNDVEYLRRLACG